MARVKGGYTTKRYRKSILKLASGYRGTRHKLFKTANESVMHALDYAYRDRRQKKRDFRKLWIVRINAACNNEGTNYSNFIHGLKLAGIEMNRKMLSEIAINDPKTFSELVKTSKKALGK